jgi:hypothetical protein
MLFLQFVLGALAGTCFSLMSAMSFNHNNADLVKLQQKLADICIMVDSVPSEFDFNNELICANGATFNYRDFK